MAVRRMTIFQDDRNRLAFEDPDEDYLAMTDSLSIKRSKARGIIRVDVRTRDGQNNVKVDEEIKNCSEEFVNENSLLIQKAITPKLRRQLPERLMFMIESCFLR